MRTVRDTGKVIGLERIAMMVALNTAYELLNKQPAVVEAPAVEVEQLKKLSERIDDALHRFRQLEIG
jgi:cell division protein ZapA